MLRRGSFTSPAVKVMLFQASAEKSDPVCDTQTATNRPKAVTALSPGTMSTAPRAAHRLPKLSATAVWFQPSSSPHENEPDERAGLRRGEDVLDDLARTRRPRVLVQVRSAISRMATSCVVDSDTA